MLYRASPAQRFAYNQIWRPAAKMYLCHVAGKAEINSLDIAKQSPAEAPGVGALGRLSSDPALDPGERSAAAPESLCSFPRETLPSRQPHKQIKNHLVLKTMHR